MTIVLFIALVVASYSILYASARLGRETILVMLSFLCTLSFLFATKIIVIAGFPLVPSAPLVAVIFYSGTILQEFFGARESRKLLYINLGTMIVFTGLGTLVRLMDLYPDAVPSQVALGNAYDTIMGFYPQALCAALAAFSTAYVLNVVLAKTLHKIFGNRLFPLRSFITVAIANLWDIGAFVTLAYVWSDASMNTIMTTWVVRLICIAAGIPVLWLIKRHFRAQNITAL